MDFAIWKARKEGEPYWEAPFGAGRPGWHIECSAMSMKYLGETLDIHCGGQDLIFPHHENEIAQSEGATGKTFARYWMHNGFININNEKMSKSAGNFFTVREIGEKYDLEAVRYFMLAAHYRSPLNFSQELIEQSKSALDRLYTAQANYEFLLEKGGTVDREPNEAEQKFIDAIPAIRERFIACMDDDMNTAGALGAIFDLVKEGNIVAVSGASTKAVKAALEAGAQGLIFPMIESREQLDQAISWATYPGHDDGRRDGEPLRENRGVGFCRANAFGKDFDAYMRDTAPRIFLVAQIEHIRAVEELDAILSQPRLDAIMVGPYDLSGSMGLTGQFDHPDFKAVMARIHEACRRHHARMGLHVVQPDPGELRRQVAAGCRFIAYGIDSVFLWQAAARPAGA